MNLNLEAKYVYDVIESCLKDYKENPEKYYVAVDKIMAIEKYYTKANKLGTYDTYRLIVGVTKNRSELYVHYIDEYKILTQISVKRPWFKGRSYHNSLIRRIRGAVTEISTNKQRELLAKAQQQFVSEIRDALPGALNNAVDEALITGENK